MKLQKIAAVSVSLLLCTTVLAGCSETADKPETEPKIISEAASETTTAAETTLSEETEKSSEAEVETYTEPAELATETNSETDSETVSETECPAGQAGFTLAVDENYKSTTDYARQKITTLFDRLVNGQSTDDLTCRIDGVKLNSLTVKNEQFFVDTYRYEVTVTLDIAESESEFLPAGTADYLLVYSPGGDRAFLPLRKVGEFDESRLLPFHGDDVKEYVNFCTYYTAYFRNLFSGDTVTDFSAPEINESDINNTVFNAYVAAIWGGGFQDVNNGIIPYSEYDETLKKILGFSADVISAKSYQGYNPENNSIEMPASGYSWICGWLAEDTEGEEAGTRVVTIDYFEDEFYLVKSQTYRYTVRINDDGTCTMLKIEHLYKSDRGILSGSV